MRILESAFIALLDLLICAALALSVGIVLTSGWTFHLHGHEVRARHPGNLLAVSFAIGFVRLQMSRVPVLGVIHPDALEKRATAAITTIRDRLVGLDIRRAAIVATIVALISLALKVYSASTHVGFLTGDDVEVHEMTFTALFHRDWSIWNLRSAFYPMTFIYPIQWLLHRSGVDDPWDLILGGRLVVAVLSAASVFLWFRVLRKPYGIPVALIAAAIFGISKLQLIYGASELPRPVATVFLIAAFGLLGQARIGRVATAGGLIGVAAALRFSEIIFVLPALCQLLMEKRFRHSVVVLVAAAATAAAIQGTSDYLYWGTPFASLQHIVDYTLIQRQSSRGLEPLWFYVTSTPDWTDIVLLGLMAVGATVAGARALLWAFLPILVLSLLPHKEPRYLVPVMPFLSLVAAQGVWRVVNVSAATSSWLVRVRTPGLLTAACLFASLLTNVNAIHFARSEPEVRLAVMLAMHPAVHGIAGDQLWRLGGRLYFMQQNVVVDIDPVRVGEAAYLRTVIVSAVDVVVIDAQNAKEQSPDATLREQGFSRVDSPVIDASGMAVFSRVGSLR